MAQSVVPKPLRDSTNRKIVQNNYRATGIEFNRSTDTRFSVLNSIFRDLKMLCQNCPEDIKVVLSEREALQLASSSMELARYDISNPMLYRHADFEDAAQHLSGPTFDRLRDFAYTGNEYGTFVLKGLPIDSYLSKTPVDGRRPSEKLSVSEAAAALVGCLIGEIFSYADEKDGLLIQNICPVQGQETLQENTGSAFLEYHTEDGFHPLPPDLLMLTCLRGDRTGKALTATASVTRALRHLDSHVVELLAKPNYEIKSSSSFGGSHYSRSVAILNNTGSDTGFIFDPSAMVAVDESSATAMRQLHEALKIETYGLCLEAGQAIIIDNTKACHARTGFIPFYDGLDRWLQRIFLTRRFSEYSSVLVPGTRMVDPTRAREIAA